MFQHNNSRATLSRPFTFPSEKDSFLAPSAYDKAACDDALAESIAKKWFATGLKLRDLLSATDHDLEDAEFKLNARDRVRSAVFRLQVEWLQASQVPC